MKVSDTENAVPLAGRPYYVNNVTMKPSLQFSLSLPSLFFCKNLLYRTFEFVMQLQAMPRHCIALLVASAYICIVQIVEAVVPCFYIVCVRHGAKRIGPCD